MRPTATPERARLNAMHSFVSAVTRRTSVRGAIELRYLGRLLIGLLAVAPSSDGPAWSALSIPIEIARKRQPTLRESFIPRKTGAGSCMTTRWLGFTRPSA